MISKENLTIEWLNKVSAKNRKADKILIEKVIRALLLLEGLIKSDIKFVFKGGTALMLLMGSTKRLSIDIDIIVSTPQELEDLFKIFIEEQGFTRFELQERKTKSDIDKAHYKFFYTPVHKSNMAEDYVLLDILFEEPHYAKVINWPIDSSFVLQEGEPIQVNIPCYEDILGDKLTAFAPNTTGIPYYKGEDLRAMEIMKQLYDIGSLLDPSEDVSIVSQTFDIFAKTEIGYRKCETDANGVLDDIYDTALHICSRGTDGKGDFEALSKGITSVKNFIFSESYHLDRAMIDAAKAAYIATVLKHGIKKFEKYTGIDQVKELVIDQSFNLKVSKLKKSNPEAFFYWHQIYLIKTA
ncbi:nucleotidyl transferase AbiEii/AbiGii toxin family protein [Pedobacter gandavensis]|uniref:nucleotidyl transferase AbiEii/AbiGii toxin family protein n=1 Tax=Pedobacter gandavensis TaxID=2679963 RepID=UPI0024788D9A|nr:nucleotidyl transferase AbiEii/AbiGii toxin family protein [Pedobacter gandavensis]WGQ08988.1 nucleotidyl transferase AbiEii/AbiGii toxin family protein [Pedobacter gandavensis]